MANVTTTDADCSNPSGSATVQTTGCSGNFAYQWNPGLGQLATQSNLAPGNYSVDVTDPSSGCNVNLPFTIANGATASNLQFNSVDVACHGGANGTATVVPDGLGPFTYNWSNGSTNASIQGLSAGTYDVTVTNGAGCVSQGSITINEPNQPVNVAILNSVDPLCNGQANGSIEVASNGGVAPYFYTWSNNAAINGPTQQNLQVGQYGVIVTDANGCSDSLLVNLSDPATVATDVSNIDNVSCFGGNDGSVSVTATGGNGGFTYQWTNPVVGGPTLNGVPAGSYAIETTDVNGCVGTLTAWVTEPDALTVTAASTDVTCNGYADGSASVTPAGGTPPYAYNWAGIPNNTSSVNNLDGGLASVTITDQSGCSIVENINIYEPAPLAVTLTPSDTICPGGNILLESNVNGGTGPFVYDWSAGQNTPSINVSPNQTTRYDLVITDDNGCVAPTLSFTVWVNNIQDVQVQLTPSQDVCLGSPAYIGATTAGGIGTYNLTWNQNNWTGNGPYTDYPDTSSWYVLTITDDCQNTLQDSLYITVNPLPEINLLQAILDHCGPMELPIADHFTGDSSYTYFWDFGNGQYGGGMYPYYTINQSGAYLVEVTATNQFGCTQTQSAYYDVTIHSEPVAQFNADQNISEFDPVAQFINQSANGATWYEWSFGDGDSSNAVNPEHTYQEPGSYTVTLVAGNEHGCSDTTDLMLNINREFTFYVPNAFTPDGDGINDQFFGQGMNYDEIEMFIYDRWGGR